MAYTKYSLTPANNNAAPPDGAPEGMLPSAVNDTMRDMMAQIRDCGDGIRGGTYTMTAPVITGGSINGATIGASSASTGAFTTLSASSTVSGTGFSNYFASPPALGGTAAAAVSSTNLSYTGTLTGGTGVVNLGSGQFYKDASGNLGVGTTTPLVTAAGRGNLTINGSTDSLLAFGNSGAISAYITASSSAFTINSQSTKPIAFEVNGAERMRINSSGYLLIGRTTDSGIDTGFQRLVVTGVGGGNGGAIGSISDAVGRNIIISDSSLANVGAININSTNMTIGTNTSNPLTFNTNGTERMRITAAGKFLVGTTTSPASGNFNSYLQGGSVFGDAETGIYISSINANTINTYSGLDNDGNSLWINYRGFNDGFTRFRNLLIGDGKGNVIATFTGSNASLAVNGALSKGSGSFRIDHPLPELEQTHNLVHSFIEGPQADLIYRGVALLVNGKASVNIDEVSGMTIGTFEALCREVQCFTSNESDWVNVHGKVTGNILNIEAQDAAANSTISWMVIGERKDKHMINTGWTDENGKVIVEPLKPPKDKLTIDAEKEKEQLNNF